MLVHLSFQGVAEILKALQGDQGSQDQSASQTMATSTPSMNTVSVVSSVIPKMCYLLHAAETTLLESLGS